ncbi:ABC transporter permease [Paraneptunicella aestuarii]|uniref:ABC transporter permease n=1 Tax=Paraneptunicella aestuarii TaxID=2831148 RepID=UPI001E3554BB|nr:ABC transporter permease [Paraneptunicella aestuarii]UAA37414.1 ABC transporter permease [Paraneptunicella aestuarii]
MNQLAYQFRFALRSLLKKRTYSLSVITSVGVSLGALVCILTLCHLLIIQPLPYKNADQLYVVTNQFLDDKGGVKGEAYTYPGVLYQDKQQSVFSETATLYYSEDVITSEPSQPTIQSTYASNGWFTMLDVPMHMGRQFDAQESLDNFNTNAILSYDAWVEHFDSNPGILDKKIDIGGKTFNIVGVTAKDFSEPQLSEKGRNTDLWLAWDFNPTTEDRRQSWSSINGSIFWVGRLTNEYSKTQAEQVLTPIINSKWQQEVSGKKFFAGWSINVKMTEMKEFITGDSSTLAILLLVGVSGLVVITCVNIACLMMSRAAEQQKHMAIQASVGARKHQLFFDKLVEVSILMAASIITAFVIALFGFELLQTYMSTVLPRIEELSLNTITVISALIIGTILALIFAYLSINAISYKALASMLQTGGKGSGLQLSRKKQQVLIATQVAIASFLIFCNIALFMDAKLIIDTDTGFEVENVTRLYLDKANETRFTKEEAVVAMTEMRNSLLNIPGVEEISQAGSPLASFSKMALTDMASDESFTPLRKQIDHQYFNILKQPLIEGRNFTEQELRSEQRVMIINEHLAKQLGSNAIGARLSTGKDAPYEVIGVVKSIQLPNQPTDIPRVYTPIVLAANYFLVKTSPGIDISRETIVSQVKETSNNYIVSEYIPLQDTYYLALFKQITTLAISAVLTVLVIALASLGIYGIVNNTVQQRRFELGTRIAIGAKKNQLVNLIVQHNLLPIVIGIAIQIALLTGMYFLFYEDINQFVNLKLIGIFVVNLAVIVGISFAACYLPMRALLSQPPAFILRN